MTELKGIDVGALDNAINEMQKMQKQIREYYKEAFKATCKHLFDEYPSLESFAWRQYTPYFNDGESCEFGVDAHEPEINGQDYYDDKDWYSETVNDGYEQKVVTTYSNRTYRTSDYSKPINERPNPHYRPDLVTASKAITKFVHAMDSDTLRSMFGDHVIVRVTRDRVETDHYHHD